MSIKEKLKGFIMGVVITSLFFSTVSFASSVEKNIKVIYDNIKIYIDGKIIALKDANGNEVEPFTYNGTTYLPVRGVSSALGKNVEWDGNTNSIYISSAKQGTVIVLNIEEEKVDNTYLETTINIIRQRLTAIGINEAKVFNVEDKQIRIEIPQVPTMGKDNLINYLTAKAMLKFLDNQNNIILDSNDIVGSKSQYGSINGTDSKQYYVVIEFSEIGKQKFADATKRISALEGKDNHIAIALDDGIIATPRVEEEIISDLSILTGDFTEESANKLAALIDSGVMPLTLKCIKYEVIE
ncbi:stalk domain-containing protein [Petroclostridium sp. X23]|uniref:SecDF P1 head subdomain-containing protein n=1 Tax=Petroclostridium sp. X23 TaxID=3045146 RepID=UPI0024AD199A|nr:stalk domain-containing protein [Petroclostridium sp. X23]WHH58261.1 stalk domain-containing protein [Petroclostridium sp. X23]